MLIPTANAPGACSVPTLRFAGTSYSPVGTAMPSCWIAGGDATRFLTVGRLLERAAQFSPGWSATRKFSRIKNGKGCAKFPVSDKSRDDAVCAYHHVDYSLRRP